MNELVFVKLGGSIITEKMRPETARPEVIQRLAGEVAAGLAAQSGLQIILGHGSGSFGHMVARRHGTAQGVRSIADWQGFAEVAAVAARLNCLVTDALRAAAVPVWPLQPSASACCRGGELVSLEITPVAKALSQGLVPLLYGDVALDEVQGGTIISTEQIFAYLARELHPSRMILVGAVDGVFDGDPLLSHSAKQMPVISAGNWGEVRTVLGGSHATDVTGGMLAKVEAMVELVREMPELTVNILSGESPGALERALRSPRERVGGTTIRR